MHKNPVWLGFLILVACVTAYFVTTASHKIFSYYTYVAPQTVHIHSWELNQDKGKYCIYLNFYREPEAPIERLALPQKDFRNEWAAKQYLAELRMKTTWVIWENSSGKILPERSFPWKATVYALLLLFITAYFFCLGFYVKRIQGGREDG